MRVACTFILGLADRELFSEQRAAPPACGDTVVHLGRRYEVTDVQPQVSPDRREQAGARGDGALLVRVRPACTKTVRTSPGRTVAECR